MLQLLLEHKQIDLTYMLLGGDNESVQDAAEITMNSSEPLALFLVETSCLGTYYISNRIVHCLLNLSSSIWQCSTLP